MFSPMLLHQVTRWQGSQQHPLGHNNPDGNMEVFPKMVVPQNGWFIMENPVKMDDLGVPLFSETSIEVFTTLKFWVFPKIMVPPNHPLKNRVFRYFHHPLLGAKNPYFLESPFSSFVHLEIGNLHPWSWKSSQDSLFFKMMWTGRLWKGANC